MKTFDADYALFQISLCQGLNQNQSSKVQNLEKLLSEFPESDFEDDALYELGRAYERMGRNADALKLYQKIINEYEFSAYYQKALLQTGLIHYNNGDYNKSLVSYKEVVENYPGTPEAQAALSGIRNNYVELNNINEYFS